AVDLRGDLSDESGGQRGHDFPVGVLAFRRAGCGRRRDRAAVRLRLPGRGAARSDDREVRGMKRSEYVALLWCWRYARVRATIGADHQESTTPSRHGDCGFQPHTHTLEGGAMTAPSLSTKDLRRVVIAAAVGNVIEWYDFYIFG